VEPDDGLVIDRPARAVHEFAEGAALTMLPCTSRLGANEVVAVTGTTLPQAFAPELR